MDLRRLTDSGISEFEALLQQEREGKPANYEGFLASDRLTEPVRARAGAQIEVVPKLSDTQRRAVGVFLRDLLEGVKDPERDKGLWAWLSLLWLSELRAGRGRKVGSSYRYIPSEDYRQFYRHLLLTPFHICRTYDPDGSGSLDDVMILLANDVSAPGEPNEQLASRQELWSNRQVLAAATSLYYDGSRGVIKPGTGDKKPGDIRRFAEVLLEQYSVNWDLNSMSTEQILGILPDEFNRFR